MSNFVEFKNGYRYLSDKIHHKGRGLKNEPVLVLIPIDKKKYAEAFKGSGNYPTYVRTGVRSSGQLINLLQGRLNEYDCYIIDKTRQVIMKAPNSNFWFAPYLVTLPKGKDTFTNEYLDKQVSKVNPIVIPKDYLEKEKKMITPDMVFDYAIPLNSYIYFSVDNHLTGSNSTTTFTYGLKSATQRNSIPLRKVNSYVESFYPYIARIDKMLDGKGLSVIDLETYKKIQDVFGQIPHMVGKASQTVENQVSAYQRESVKRDVVVKNITQKELKDWNWSETLENANFNHIVDSLKNNITLYANSDIVEELDKVGSKETTIDLMNIIFSKIAEVVNLRSGESLTNKQVAVSANGYKYLLTVLETILR